MYIKNLLKTKTDTDRLKFLYRVVEKLRLEHNKKGKEFKDGIITQTEFDAYKNTFFARNKTVLSEVSVVKEQLDLLNENRMTEMSALKEAGKNIKKWDKDIDITKI